MPRTKWTLDQLELVNNNQNKSRKKKKQKKGSTVFLVLLQKQQDSQKVKRSRARDGGVLEGNQEKMYGSIIEVEKTSIDKLKKETGCRKDLKDPVLVSSDGC